MPKINFEVPHSLSADDAKDKLQKFAESLQSRFKDQVSDLQQSWNADDLVFGFKTFGIKVDGRIGVQPEKIAVDCDLPFSAMMFKGKIESEMRKQLERLLGATA